MNDQRIAIIGSPRSGTTLMMRFLDFGHVPPTDGPPAYEGPELTPNSRTRPGYATKLMQMPLFWPQLLHHERGEQLVAIHCVRDHQQQFLSQRKFMGRGVPPKTLAANDNGLRNMCGRQASIVRVEVEFEDMLVRPAEIQKRLLYEAGIKLDDACVEAVIDRGPECQPDLSIEMQLVADYEENH